MKAKRTFYITYDSTTTQIAAPINWQNDNLTLERNDDIKTIVRAVTYDDLIFTFDDTTTPVNGSTLLQGIFEADGADAEATLTTYYLTDENEYEFLYEGSLNFSGYSFDTKTKAVSITLTDSSDLERFNNRKGISFGTDEAESYDGETITALTAETITLQKQELTRTEEFTMHQDVTLEVNELERETTVASNGDFTSATYKTFSLLPPPVTALSLYEATGSSTALSTYTSAYTTCLIGATTESYAKILVSDYTLKMRASSVEFDTVLTAILTIRQISGSTTVKTITKTMSVSLTTSDVSFDLESEEIGEFYLEKEDYIEWNLKVTQSTSADITYSSVSQSVEYAEFSSIENERDDNYTGYALQYSDEDITSEFVDEITLPQGDDITDLFENQKEYTRLINVVIDEEDSVTIDVEGVVEDSFSAVLSSYIQLIDTTGDVMSTTLLYTKSITALGSYTEQINDVDVTFTLPSSYKLQITSTLVSSILDETDIIDVSVVHPSTTVKLIEMSPDDSTIESFGAFDVLTHLSNIMLGESKMTINSDIISSANKDNLNSGYGLKIVRGSYIRGFGSTDDGENGAPLNVDFITLFTSLSNLLGLGLEYSDGIFYLDYLTNIETDDIISIGDVSEFTISSADDIPVTLQVGDAEESDIEDFYLSNESHNPTHYAYPTVTAVTALDYTTEILTAAIPIEIMRRYNAVDTEDLSLNTDSSLYFIKCYSDSGLTSEKEERITIDSTVDNSGDLNLCFLPSYVIQNNKEYLGRAFFRKSGTKYLKYTSSTYAISLTTTNNLTTFVEQANILSTIIGDQKNDPIIYDFKLPIDDDVLAAVSAAPNAKIMFTYDGETYIGRIKTSAKNEIFFRNGEWQLEKAN